MENRFVSRGHSATAKMPNGQEKNDNQVERMEGVPEGYATVGTSAAVKYNINTKDPKTGNFVGVSFTVSAHCSLPCTPETAEITYQNCEEFVAQSLVKSRSSYIEKFDLQDWFGK